MLSLQTEFFEDKSVFRKKALEYRKSLSTQKKAEMDGAIVRELLTFDNVKSAETVLMFSPIKGEPDIMPVAKELIARGIQVAFPISHPDTLTLDFRCVSSTEQLSVGAYGISEPPADAPKVTSTRGTVCLVPALMFDKYGMRIGYGKGYYDRFLAETHVYTIGITYRELVKDMLPCEQTDIPVDLIITESGVILPDEKATTEHDK